MSSILEWGDVLSALASARDAEMRIANFFPDEERMKVWCVQGRFVGARYPGSQFFLHDVGKFSSLYFLSKDIDSLGADLRRLHRDVRDVRLILDVIGTDATLLSLKSTLAADGFRQIAELRRMSRKTPESNVRIESCVEPARVDDLGNIQAVFSNYFNPEVEQLPSDGEIERWIHRGELLVHRNGKGQMDGFVIYDLSPASLYLRYWFTMPEIRGAGVGGALMRTMFANAKHTKRQYFWVLSDNGNAIKRYQHYGFAFEAMKDCVMAREKGEAK